MGLHGSGQDAATPLELVVLSGVSVGIFCIHVRPCCAFGMHAHTDRNACMVGLHACMVQVTVHFQEIIDKEGEDYEVVPNSQFTIARTAHRNNTSDYYINDRKVAYHTF